MKKVGILLVYKPRVDISVLSTEKPTADLTDISKLQIHMEQGETLRQEMTKIVAEAWQTHEPDLQVDLHVSHTHEHIPEMRNLSTRGVYVFEDKTFQWREIKLTPTCISCNNKQSAMKLKQHFERPNI